MKRTAALILTLMLVLVPIVGCSTTPTSPTPAPTTPAAATPADTTPAATTEPPAPTPTEVKPGWMEDTSPITFDVYFNASWFAEKWGQGDVTTAYITKKTGVNVNYIAPTGNEAEKINTLIASGKLPDFFMVDFWNDGYKQAIAGNLVVNLKELADNYDPYFYTAVPPSIIGWHSTDDGKLFGVPEFAYPPERLNSKVSAKSNKTFSVRKDIYEAIGKPEMRTPEGFLNALKLAKEKFPQGDDSQPLIPFGVHEFTTTGNDSFQDYLQDFLAVPLEKDGKLNDRQSDPEYLRWLKVFRQAYETGLLTKDIFIDKRDQMEEKIANGRYFAMLYQWTDFQTPQTNRYKAKPDSIYVPIDGPADSKLDNPLLPAAGGLTGWMMTTISAANKDPKRAIRFLSYLCSVEGQKDVFLGPEGVVWEMKDGKETLLPEVRKLLTDDSAAFKEKYNCFGNNWTWFDPYSVAQWEDPAAPEKKIFHDWAAPYCVNTFEALNGIDPTADSEEGIIKKQIDEEWGTTLPTLLMAKSDAEFDQIWSAYTTRKAELGFDKLQAFRQVKYDANKKKLGLK